MPEKQIKLHTIDPLVLFGANNENIDFMNSLFPKLKIIARGDIIKIMGEEEEIEQFETRLFITFKHIEKYQSIAIVELKRIFETQDLEQLLQGEANSPDTIVYGKNGNVVKARTINQNKMVEAFKKNDMIFAIGPAGTGKTYTAVALAVKALRYKEVKRIILTRPAVEAGENLGFLPGDLKEKLDPYLRPLYDALRDMIPQSKLIAYLEDNTIEIAPLAYMRGRTLENVFAILDEAQNATENQLKMFITRMGRASKFIITGDITQIDLPKPQHSGLLKASEILKNIDGIDFIYFDERDVVRHQLVTKIINAYQKINSKETT